MNAVFILRKMQEKYHPKEKNIVNALCEQSTEESVGMGNEEERKIRSFD